MVVKRLLANRGVLDTRRQLYPKDLPPTGLFEVKTAIEERLLDLRTLRQK